jgi:hypothetical protein
MESLPRRALATFKLTVPLMVSYFILFYLVMKERIRICWAISVFQLYTSPVLLRELIGSARPGSITVRLCRPLTGFIKPTEILFEMFEIVRLMCVFLIFDVLNFEKTHHGSEDCGRSEDKSNSDIVGSGVRLSMYLLFLTVFASLFIGSFHSGPSGTKELGIATLISRYKRSHRDLLVRRILTKLRSHIPNDQPPKGRRCRLDADGWVRHYRHDQYPLRYPVSDPFVQGCARVAVLRLARHCRAGQCLGSSPIHRHTLCYV